MMSSISKRRREGSRNKIKSLPDHKEFLKRITKSLCYGQLPSLPCLSLPVTEISCSVWSAAQAGRSVRRLRRDAAAAVARSACVSPCAVVLALLYLERLNANNPEYLAKAHPSEVFLVSLMVGSKFLQDDGEDDDVLCSEWAVSGGIELAQLKQLELEFLSAIDWKIYVNDKSFEAGLLWLEKQVALKQSQLHGFCTYSDIVSTHDRVLLTALIKSATAAWLTAAFSYLASLFTLLASTWIISNTFVPTLQPITTTSATVYKNIMSHNLPLQPTGVVNDSNADVDYLDTLSKSIDVTNLNSVLQSTTTTGGKCCQKWHMYQQNVEPFKSWHNSGVFFERESFDTWWSKTSVLNWLYQSSLINPTQRWLEKFHDNSNLYQEEISRDSALLRTNSPRLVQQCHVQGRQDMHQHCIRQWFNLNKLSALVVSVSDR